MDGLAEQRQHLSEEHLGRPVEHVDGDVSVAADEVIMASMAKPLVLTIIVHHYC